MNRNTLKFVVPLSFLILILCGVLILNVVFTRELDQNEHFENVPTSKVFDAYLKKFNKSYTEAEYKIRLKYFRAALVDIAKKNRETGAVYGLSVLSDRSQAEIRRRFITRSRIAPRLKNTYSNCSGKIYQNLATDNLFSEDLPDYKDWREEGMIGPVLNQGNCNGCWAYSIVETMESMAVKQKMNYTRLSIQELLDCVSVCEGCNKGHVEEALNEMCINDTVVTTEDNYPLGISRGNCNSSTFKGRKIKEYWHYSFMDENILRRVIAHHGPVIVKVNAQPWINYLGGIIQRGCMRSEDGATLDHAVQIVGYNARGSVPYYIVRNSYGADFGIGGYVKLAMYRNICGLADDVAFLTVY